MCPRPSAGGRVSVDRIADVVDQAVKVLAGLTHIILVLVGSKMPVAFVAYPDKPSLLSARDVVGHVLARPEEDLIGALEALADEVGARSTPAPVSDGPPPKPAIGAITSEALGVSLAALLPANAIVVDEAVTTGRGFFAPTRLAAPHDWLSNMGGSIGMGMPVATSAAVACPDRKVVCLEGDGSGMYTLQALWTQAREGLGVTTLLFSNRSYAILKGELALCRRRQSRPQSARHARYRPPRSRLGGPRPLDGRARRAGHDDGSLQRPLCRGHRHPGPFLVEVVL